MAANAWQMSGWRKPSSARKVTRFIKRETRRLARRLAKLLMEDAPRRITRGWAD